MWGYNGVTDPLTDKSKSQQYNLHGQSTCLLSKISYDCWNCKENLTLMVRSLLMLLEGKNILKKDIINKENQQTPFLLRKLWPRINPLTIRIKNHNNLRYWIGHKILTVFGWVDFNNNWFLDPFLCPLQTQNIRWQIKIFVFDTFIPNDKLPPLLPCKKYCVYWSDQVN